MTTSKAIQMGQLVEAAAKQYTGPDAELYDFGGGWSVAPVPDKGQGFLTGFMFVVCNSSEVGTKEGFRYTTCDLSADTTEEELLKAVKETFEKFRNK